MKFKRILAMALSLVTCVALCGCTIETPYGTIDMKLDESKKSDQTKVIGENGKETIIPTGSIFAYVDALLDEVALPNGATTGELKTFVYDTIGLTGIDLRDLDDGTDLNDIINQALGVAGLDMSNPAEVEKAIKDALEEQGIDTSEVDINLGDLIQEDGEVDASENLDEGAEEGAVGDEAKK